MRVSFFVGMIACLSPVVMTAQKCPPTPPTGPAPAWFEYQVDAPAQFVAKDAVLPYPDASLNQRASMSGDLALVQFIVDTAGVPNTKSVKLLQRPDALVADSVVAAAAQWRYVPAKAHGCVVPQLVQVALRWK